MNVLIASYNLSPENSHLMPWRYVCEIADYFNNNGHNAKVVSIDHIEGEFTLNSKNLKIGRIRKKKELLFKDIQSLIVKYSIDAIFWPVSWRERTYRLKSLKRTGLPIIGYFPGGMYTFKEVLYAIKSIGLVQSIPYVLEVISPKRRKLKIFKEHGVNEIITMTEWTARCITDFGWPSNNVAVTLPGKEICVHDDNTELPEAFRNWINDSKYIVFMGPPTPIRGGYELLEAFDLAAELNASIKLVCLFRSDVGVDKSKMEALLQTIDHADRVYVLWESLERRMLEAYISNSFAIALPFVLVPSEIPLALIDAASYDKLVITTNCGGSGKFAEEYGVTVDLSDTQDFAKKIIDLVGDDELYSQKCNQAKLCFERHPTWDDMSAAWLDIANKSLTSTSSKKYE